MTICISEPTRTNQPPHSWKCDCVRCARHRKQYRIEHDRGHRRLVDAAATREHLEWLSSQGVGRRTLCSVFGFADLTLARISSGKTLKVRLETERKITAFRPNDAATVANARIVDATATHLRYQALIALGYTQAWVATSTGRAHVGMDLGQRVARRRALAILELCRTVGDTPGPSHKAALQAKNRGWRMPADFDEDLFYSPAWDGTEPDVACTLSPSAKLTHVQDYDFLHETTGLSVLDAAPRLGVTQGYLADLLSKRERGLAPFGSAR
jgi:hypothetical protein